MRVLIDTHILLWFISDDSQLSLTAKALLESDADVLVSVASLWEIAIKVSIAKLRLPGEFEEFLSQQINLNQIEILPIEIPHLKVVSMLPFHHRDPFDRLIAAQALASEIDLVSVDTIFDKYGVNRIY
jgi:PIN domain nuclease of toxin-antitoxin system